MSSDRSTTALDGASSLPRGIEDLRGQIFEERYRVVEVCVVGHDRVVFGGMAVEDERAILLQLLRPAAVSDGAPAERLAKRVRATRRVRDAAVVRPIDSGERFDGTLYLVSERPPGVPLPSFMAERSEGALRWGVTRSLLLQLVRALGAIHKRKLVHGALHPDVCWVHDDDRAEPSLRLLGLGSNVDPVEDESQVRRSGTAPFSGDPHYVAPENVRGALGDARSDIYGVGLLAYTMLVGHPPFREGSPFQVLALHLKGAVPSVRERVPELPEGVDALVSTMLAKDPDRRPQTMTEIEQELLALPVEEEPADGPTFDAPASTPSPLPTFEPPPSLVSAPAGSPMPSSTPSPASSPASSPPSVARSQTHKSDSERAPTPSRRNARASSVPRKPTDIYNAQQLDEHLEAPAQTAEARGASEPSPRSSASGVRSTEVFDARAAALERHPTHDHPQASPGATVPAIPPSTSSVSASAAPVRVTPSPPRAGATASAVREPGASRSEGSLMMLLLMTAVIAAICGVGVGVVISGRLGG